MAKKSAKKSPAKIAPASKVRSKSEIYTLVAEGAEISRKQAAAAFDTLSRIISADLKKNVPVNVPGLMKVTVIRKPATKARQGINPFTKEPTTFKAKPARNVVKVRALKGLKDMV